MSGDKPRPLLPRCEACWAAWMAALDYQLPPAPVRRVSEVRLSEQERDTEWRTIVRARQDAVGRACREGRHARSRG